MKELIDFDNPNTQVEDIIKVGIARYKDKYFPGRIVDSPFVLYEKYSRRDLFAGVPDC